MALPPRRPKSSSSKSSSPRSSSGQSLGGKKPAYGKAASGSKSYKRGPQSSAAPYKSARPKRRDAEEGTGELTTRGKGSAYDKKPTYGRSSGSSYGGSSYDKGPKARSSRSAVSGEGFKKEFKRRDRDDAPRSDSRRFNEKETGFKGGFKRSDDKKPGARFGRARRDEGDDRPVSRDRKPRGARSDSGSRYQPFGERADKKPFDKPRHENDRSPIRASRTGAKPLRDKDDALWLEPGDKGPQYPVGIPWVVGRNAVLAILRQSPKRIIKLFMAEGMGTERRLTAIESEAKENGITVQYVERAELDKRCTQLDDPDVAHQGVLAEVLPKDAVSLYNVMERLKATEKTQKPAGQPLIIALDKITDPRNVGAILRVADGVGAMAVMMAKRHQAGWGPALSKSASGADATVDVVMVPNLVQALKDLKAAGAWIVGAAGDDDTPLYTDYALDRPTVLVMGSEGDGLSRLTRATCDYLVRIPMMGAMTSLNVSTATAVLAYGWRSSKQGKAK